MTRAPGAINRACSRTQLSRLRTLNAQRLLYARWRLIARITPISRPFVSKLGGPHACVRPQQLEHAASVRQMISVRGVCAIPESTGIIDKRKAHEIQVAES